MILHDVILVHVPSMPLYDPIFYYVGTCTKYGFTWPKFYFMLVHVPTMALYDPIIYYVGTCTRNDFPWSKHVPTMSL